MEERTLVEQVMSTAFSLVPNNVADVSDITFLIHFCVN
jgi:hypothetical protein